MFHYVVSVINVLFYVLFSLFYFSFMSLECNVSLNIIMYFPISILKSVGVILRSLLYIRDESIRLAFYRCANKTNIVWYICSLGRKDKLFWRMFDEICRTQFFESPNSSRHILVYSLMYYLYLLMQNT